MGSARRSLADEHSIVHPSAPLVGGQSLSGEDDILVQVGPLLELVPSWARHVSVEPDEATRRQLRLHEATGRPAGSERFLKRLEKLLGRVLRPGKPGRRKKPTRN